MNVPLRLLSQEVSDIVCTGMQCLDKQLRDSSYTIVVIQQRLNRNFETQHGIEKPDTLQEVTHDQDHFCKILPMSDPRGIIY